MISWRGECDIVCVLMADVVIGKGYMRSCGRGGGGGPGKQAFFFFFFFFFFPKKSFYWVGSGSVFRSGSRVSDRGGLGGGIELKIKTTRHCYFKEPIFPQWRI